jgi:4'-phosphopantetheinyl transferase
LDAVVAARWVRTTATCAPPGLDRLTTAERDHVAGLRRADARSRYVASRNVLRELASDLLGLPSAQIQFAYDPGGRPRIDPALADVSIAHTGDVVIVALAIGVMVGVDIERRDRTPLPPWRLWLSAAETRKVDAATNRDRHDLLLRFWTAKEAAVKGLGHSETVPFRDIDVLDLGDGWLAGRPAKITWPSLVNGHRTALALLERRDAATTSGRPAT